MIPLLYPLLTAALYYLGTRAKITHWLWSRYPAWLAGFMDCAACTGFWYGFVVECCFGEFHTRMGSHGWPAWYAAIVASITAGLSAIVWTPIVAAIMQQSLDSLGSAVPVDGGVSPLSESQADGD